MRQVGGRPVSLPARGAAAPGPGAAPAARAPATRPHLPVGALTSVRPGQAPRRRGPRLAPLHALNLSGAAPATPGPPPPAPSRCRPLREHNGATAPLIHMHDAARRHRPQARAVEPRAGGREGGCGLRGAAGGRGGASRGPGTKTCVPAFATPLCSGARGASGASCSVSTRTGPGSGWGRALRWGGGACGLPGVPEKSAQRPLFEFWRFPSLALRARSEPRLGGRKALARAHPWERQPACWRMAPGAPALQIFRFQGGGHSTMWMGRFSLMRLSVLGAPVILY